MKALDIVILAAGKGTRMKSSLPKVMMPIAGKPILAHIIAAAKTLDPRDIVVVIGPDSDTLRAEFVNERVTFVEQTERKGTGHAVMQAMPLLEDGGSTLVLLGDTPLLTATALQGLVQSKAAVNLLSFNAVDPTGYGRVKRGSDGFVQGVVEEKLATPAERLIKEVSSGVFFFTQDSLARWLPKLTDDNAQGEYLLPAVIEHALADGEHVDAVLTNDPDALVGINDLVQLASAERVFQRRQAEALMRDGVRIIDPDRIDIRGTVSIAPSALIDVNVVIEGDVTIEPGVVIESHSVVRDSFLGAGSRVKAHSHIEGAHLAEDCQVGPYARLRPGARLERDVSVGNFVEVKATTMGKGSKASHLSYLGDATIGASVNIGAGTITCNYDGVNKWQTVLEDGVFVGSNTALVAPVHIEQGATIGAGSTITARIEHDALGIGRGKQRNIPNWPRPTKQTTGEGLVVKKKPQAE